MCPPSRTHRGAGRARRHEGGAASCIFRVLKGLLVSACIRLPLVGCQKPSPLGSDHPPGTRSSIRLHESGNIRVDLPQSLNVGAVLWIAFQPNQTAINTVLKLGRQFSVALCSGLGQNHVIRNRNDILTVALRHEIRSLSGIWKVERGGEPSPPFRLAVTLKELHRTAEWSRSFLRRHRYFRLSWPHKSFHKGPAWFPNF